MGRKIDRALKWKKSTRSSPPPHRCPVDLEFNAVASPSECRPLYYHRLSGLRCGKLGQLTQVTESRSSFSGPAVGDYVNVGVNTISVVDANSFWVDGYFEETNLARIRVGDPAQIKLMGYSQIVRGHVDSIARAINVANAQPNNQGVANVNPIFTWVRLAQRIPVRIHIDEVAPGVVLAAGMTATVEINDRGRSSAK